MSSWTLTRLAGHILWETRPAAPCNHSVMCYCVVLFGAPQTLPSRLHSDFRSAILKGASLLFLQAAAVTSFFCDRSLSVLLRRAGLNDCHTKLHCPQSCDVGAQESHGGGPLCAFRAWASVSLIPSQIFSSLHICEHSLHSALCTCENSLPGFFFN